MLNVSNKKVVFVGSHPDDIELTSGGFVSVLLRNGNSVKFVVVTDGAYETHDHKRSKATAWSEQSKVLNDGIDLNVIGYKTGELKYDNMLVKKIEDGIAGADIVVTHNKGELHHEHGMVSDATMEASRNCNNVLMWSPYILTSKSLSVLPPNLYIELLEHDMDFKKRLIGYHVTEVERGNRTWLSEIDVTARYNGMTINKDYAEVYYIVRMASLKGE